MRGSQPKVQKSFLFSKRNSKSFQLHLDPCISQLNSNLLNQAPVLVQQWHQEEQQVPKCSTRSAIAFAPRPSTPCSHPGCCFILYGFSDCCLCLLLWTAFLSHWSATDGPAPQIGRSPYIENESLLFSIDLIIKE